MNHSIFLLSDEQITVNRFHVCTWDLLEDNACIEVGCEINPGKEKKIVIYLPFFEEGMEIVDLYSSFAKSENIRFIFNDKVKNIVPDDGTGRRAIDVTFEEREPLRFIKCEDKKIIKKTISFTVNHKEAGIPYYFRILIKSNNKNTFAINRKGITQSNYIYDFKVNEKRNMPEDIDNLIMKEGLKLATISTFFCLNVVPDNFQISFIDSSKLKNIRKLENELFSNYLPTLKSLKKDRYLIIFLKHKIGETDKNCSLFVSYTNEHFGIAQVAYSIFLNIICTLLFSFGSLRISGNNDLFVLSGLPGEYIIGFIFVISFIVYLISPWMGRFFRKIINSRDR